jgi:hypothetical protein
VEQSDTHQLLFSKLMDFRKALNVANGLRSGREQWRVCRGAG